jgi:hypothetical protein
VEVQVLASTEPVPPSVQVMLYLVKSVALVMLLLRRSQVPQLLLS